MFYEQHKLKGGKFPFIFHYNKIEGAANKNTNWHENLEILFVTGGAGKIICDFEASHVECGDLFVINSNCLHSTEGESCLTYYCLIIDNSFCCSNGIDPREVQFQKKINDCEAARLYYAAVSAFSDTSELRELRVKAAVLSLLLFLSEKHIYAPDRPKNRPKLFSSARVAVEYIKANFTRPLSVDEISAKAGYSRAYFSREFKALTGLTVVEFINCERCTYARTLLLSGASVSESATASGFESASYFNRTYKRVMGHSPISDKNRADSSV